MNQTSDRILVVDDDENILFLLTRALERAGYAVTSTSNSLEALSRLQAGEKFSVLLTDLLMPGLSGMDLLQQGRQIDPDLEIVVITAAGSIETAIRALRDGNAWDYLLKPLDSFQQVAVVIDRAATHRRLNLERRDLQSQVAAEADRLRALVASVGEAIIAASGSGILTVVNPAAGRLLGINPNHGVRVEDSLPQRLLNILENWQVVGRHYPAALEITWGPGLVLLIQLNPMPDGGWVLAARDITPQKMGEKLKTQAMAEVAGKIQLLLAQAMNSLVELNRRTAGDEGAASHLFRLTRLWENIGQWADELLSVAQADHVRAPCPEPVDIDSLLKQIRETPPIHRFVQGGARLVVEANPDLPTIYTDHELLSEAVVSLVRRALRRSRADGVVQIRTRLLNDRVWMDLVDCGPIANDTAPLAALGGTLQRLGGEPDQASATAGVDLARARAILERLEGQVWIGGHGPRGSTISICLPVNLTLTGGSK